MSVHTCPVVNCRTTDEFGNRELISTPLCDWHRSQLDSVLAELPYLYVKLNLALAPGQSSGLDEHVAVSKEKPLGVSVPARSLQEDIVHSTAYAEDAYRASAGLSTSPTGREGRALQNRCIFLSRHLDRLLDLRAGLEMALDVFRLRRAAYATLGLGKHVDRLPAPCPSCDTMALERESGASQVECRSCGRTFAEADYARLVLILSSDYAA